MNELTKQEQEALVRPCKDSTLIIQKQDKGNGIVVLDRTDYDEKMNDILKDTDKFRKLESNIDKLKWEVNSVFKTS